MIKQLFVFSFLLFSFFSKAQPNTDSSITQARFDKYYLTSFLKDYRNIFTSPFKPSVKKYTLAAAYGGTMYLLISHYDEKIQIFAQDNRSKCTNHLSTYVFEPMGQGIFPFMAIGLLYTEGMLWKNQKSKKVAMNAVKSFLIASSFAQLSKHIISRQRPLVSPPDANKWFMSNDNVSFFSGHTTTAFSMATVFAEEYKSTVWVPVLAYTMAAGAGLSRINLNKHWASDVLTGALVGYLTGKLVVCQNNWGIKVVPRLIIQ